MIYRTEVSARSKVRAAALLLVFCFDQTLLARQSKMTLDCLHTSSLWCLRDVIDLLVS